MYNTQKKYREICEAVVTYIAKNRSEFSELSYDANSENFSNSEEYVCEMPYHSVYDGYCKLVATGNLFPFLYEVYYNKEL